MINGWKGQEGSILTVSIQWDSSWPRLAEDCKRDRLFSYLEERFGIPKPLFDRYLLFETKRSWWLLSHYSSLGDAARLKVCKVGLRAFHKIGGFVKPTTRMMQAFGHAATKGKIELDEHQLFKLLEGRELEVGSTLANGYVLLVLPESGVLGTGLLINGRVRSQIPKKQAEQMGYIVR